MEGSHHGYQHHGRDLILIIAVDLFAAATVLVINATGHMSDTLRTWLLAGCVVVGLAAVYWLLPQWQVRSAAPAKRAELEDKARATLGSLIGSFSLVATVAFTLVQLNETRQAQDRTLQVTESGQLGERFSRAIDQLGSGKLDVRLGGLYALERFARTRQASFELTNLDDRQTVGRVLSAYIREHAKRRRARDSLLAGAACEVNPRAVPTDVAAALDILRTLFPADAGVELPRDTPELNLAGTDLSGADLSGMDLGFANLSDALLVRTSFADSWLNNATLAGADARGACFRGAKLDVASFTAAPVETSIPGVGPAQSEPPPSELRDRAAKLMGTSFAGSSAVETRFMYSDLRCSDLTNAEIIGARFDRADVRAVALEGAMPPSAIAAIMRWTPRGATVPPGLPPGSHERIAFCGALLRP